MVARSKNNSISSETQKGSYYLFYFMYFTSSCTLLMSFTSKFWGKMPVLNIFADSRLIYVTPSGSSIRDNVDDNSFIHLIPLLVLR